MGHVTCQKTMNLIQQGKANKMSITGSIPWPRGLQGLRSNCPLGFPRRIYGKPLFLHVFTLKFRSFRKFLPENLGIGWWTSEHQLQSVILDTRDIRDPLHGGSNPPWPWVQSLSTPNTKWSKWSMLGPISLWFPVGLKCFSIIILPADPVYPWLLTP